jgi:hypothetical protein
LLSRRPDDETPDPPGGRAKRRLEDFLERRSMADDDTEVPSSADDDTETEDESSTERDP